MGNAIITRRGGGGKPEGEYAWEKYDTKLQAKLNNVQLTSLPYDFKKGGCVVYNNEIHILGSVVSGNRTKHYKWDGNSWVSVSTLPYDFFYGGCVVYNNEIHILGGNSPYTKYHYKWNGTEWTSVSTLPYDFFLGGCVIFNNEIHIIGGSDTSAYRMYHYKWNGTSWTSCNKIPYYFQGGIATTFNNTIHIIGSYVSSYTTKHYSYNVSNDSWNVEGSLSNTHIYGCATEYYVDLYVYGGTSTGATLIEKYDANAQTWASVGTLPYTFTMGESIVYDDKIHIMGTNDSSIGTNHFSIAESERVKSDDFISYIVDNNSSKYPDKEIVNNVYYELVRGGISPSAFGCTKFAVDTYIPTTDHGSYSDVTIPHSLGEIPKIAILVRENPNVVDANINGVVYTSGVTTNSTGTIYYPINCYATYNASIYYDNKTYFEKGTSTNIQLYAYNGSYGLKTGITYTIITMA